MSVKSGARQSYLLAGAALTVLGLAGCSSSSDSDPTTLPTLSPSASTASPTPSVSPSETGKQAELAAATAVVRQYFRLLGSPTNTSTVRALKAVVLPSCKCNQVIHSFQDAIKRHQHYVGTGHITVVRPAYDSPSSAEVLVRFNASAGGLVDANGNYVNRVDAVRDIAENFYLYERSGGWKISQVTLIAKGH